MADHAVADLHAGPQQFLPQRRHPDRRPGRLRHRPGDVPAIAGAGAGDGAVDRGPGAQPAAVHDAGVSHRERRPPRPVHHQAHTDGRLEREGTGYRDIREHLLSELAARHLRESRLPVDAVAILLGYSDADAFRKAFRRW